MKMHVFIAGAGGIGQAAALILLHSREVDCHVYLGDLYQKPLENAKHFLTSSGIGEDRFTTTLMPESGSSDELNKALQSVDVVLDCLPGSQAPRMARLALGNDCHYANLTEYVEETNEIVEFGKEAHKGLALQTGLAPGFINILACKLYKDFQEKYGSEMLDEMTMKVGAISDHAPSPHFYAFTWSPIGVATEYIKDAILVKDYITQPVPSLSGQETIIIDGQVYEDNFTSGGAADLPQAFEGKIKNLHYKTLRHPGHYDWVKSIISEEKNDQDKINALEATMLNTIGHVEDDYVVIYSSVQGKDSGGVLRRLEKSYKIYPTKIGGKKLRAIQTTTAVPLIEMAVMMVKNNTKGLILQSQVDPDQFLNGSFVKAIYGNYHD